MWFWRNDDFFAKIFHFYENSTLNRHYWHSGSACRPRVLRSCQTHTIEQFSQGGWVGPVEPPSGVQWLRRMAHPGRLVPRRQSAISNANSTCIAGCFPIWLTQVAWPPDGNPPSGTQSPQEYTAVLLDCLGGQRGDEARVMRSRLPRIPPLILCHFTQYTSMRPPNWVVFPASTHHLGPNRVHHRTRHGPKPP